MNFWEYQEENILLDDHVSESENMYEFNFMHEYSSLDYQLPFTIFSRRMLQHSPLNVNYAIFPDKQQQRKKRLQEFSNSLIKNDPKYIADNLYAIQIVQELTNAGQCKISNLINGHYQTQLEQIIKYDKHLQNSRLDQSNQKQIFFININPVEIFFQDGQIDFKQSPPKLEINQSIKKKYHYLLQILNLTLRILDACFIKDFQAIINRYIDLKEKKYSNQKIIEFIQNEIEKNADQYPYMTKWLEIKSKVKPVLVIYKQIKILEKKDELSHRKSLKVLSKHIKKIDKLQKRLYLEQILSPVEFLLQNLFEIFDLIVKCNEQNSVRNLEVEKRVKMNKTDKIRLEQLKESNLDINECEQEQINEI